VKIADVFFVGCFFGSSALPDVQLLSLPLVAAESVILVKE